MRPRTAGFFNMSWASVKYYSPEHKLTVSVILSRVSGMMETLCLHLCLDGLQQCSWCSASDLLWHLLKKTWSSLGKWQPQDDVSVMTNDILDGLASVCRHECTHHSSPSLPLVPQPLKIREPQTEEAVASVACTCRLSQIHYALCIIPFLKSYFHSSRLWYSTDTRMS